MGGREEYKIAGSNFCIRIYRQMRHSRHAGQMAGKTHTLLTISKQGMEKIMYTRIVRWTEF